MTNRQILLVASLSLAAACGDDSNARPDAPLSPDGGGGTCSTATAGEITSYPGTFTGTVIGGGADLTVPEDACTEQVNDFWFDPVGEDVVVRLANLTAGQAYVVTLTTEEDISFYVTSDCPPASGAVTNCQLYSDFSYGTEQGSFVATGTEHFLVVDHLVDPEFPLTDGNFEVEVLAAECTEETEATACAAPTPFCVDFQCVQCASSFDCSGDTPVCSAESMCVAGPMTCTGDDVNDTTAPGDDGPAVATMIAAPGATTPTVVDGGICNSPNTEADWYTVTLPAGDIGISLDFTGATNDLDVYLLTAAGTVVEAGQSNAGISEAIRANDLVAGNYYVVVTQYAPANTVAAVPYTLTLRQPACDTDFDCLVPTAPVCGGAGSCGAGPNLCVGDDTAAETGGDDGPAGARLLVSGAAMSGSICSSPASEADFYRIVVADGQGMNVTVAWTGTADLDPVVYDNTGRAYGFSYYRNPETVALTYLRAGTYYIKVSNFGQASTTVQAYTITTSLTAAQNCTTSAQCAAEHQTQLYRGQCITTAGPDQGSCTFIPAGSAANGAACDSGDDCTSGRCSYIAFDADAQDSVCTTTCTTTADCTAVGTGLTCTSLGSGATNFCVPSCTSDLECGANTGSSMIDTGLPWNFLTCTAATGVCSL